ncbi:MAG: bifunctional biotin--[acetyl-CoA-carboxylase] ligase/biotin operon repressor BirA [Rhodoferax sp.]
MPFAPDWTALYPTLRALERALAPQGLALHAQALTHIDSTNAELMRRGAAGQYEPTLLVAAHQSAGRGRLGRQWLDVPGDAVSDPQPSALMASLGLLLAPPDWSGLSLAVGWSLADSLHPDIGLKWPNDLWWRGRKLGGILIETAQLRGLAARWLVIGWGINLWAPPDAGLRTPAAGLRTLRPGLDAAGVLQAVVPPLVGTVLRFAQEGFAPFQAGFAARDVLAGQWVQTSDGQVGLGCGVDADGALRLRTEQGMLRVTSSEVSVRPGPAPVCP